MPHKVNPQFLKVYQDTMGWLHVWESWEQENMLASVFVQAESEIDNFLADAHLTREAVSDGYTNTNGYMSSGLWDIYKRHYS